MPIRYRKKGHVYGKYNYASARRRMMSKSLKGGINLKPNHIFTFRQYVADAPISQTTSFYGGAFDFQLAYMADVTPYATLFDSFRIVKIEQFWRPMFNVNNLQGATAALVAVPLLYLVVDWDDSSTPATASELQQHSNCKTIMGNKNAKIVLQPRTIDGGNYDAKPTSTWYDCAHTDTSYKGIKVGITAGIAGSLQTWHVSTRYTIQFKTVR